MCNHAAPEWGKTQVAQVIVLIPSQEKTYEAYDATLQSADGIEVGSFQAC
jgi:hypothetical protein